MQTEDKVKKLMLGIETLSIDCVQSVFKQAEGFLPTMFIITKDTYEAKSNPLLIDVDPAFSLPKPLRDTMLSVIVAKSTPIVCSIITEAWMVKKGIDNNTFKNKDILNIVPSEHEDRQECIIIETVSPYGSKLTTIPINLDFTKIVDGVPQKTLGEPSYELGFDSFKSFMSDIYNKVGPSKSYIEEIVK